ncbi:hypothetical protein A8F94_01410 [Bacillus sp. FJAT-27225]|uniref:carboxylesterase family protein n=1 Tax=Bacillus sp. FJAT-27225 TaxID=1743144 RepID=UPI00080C2239|nr:dienelactone hydrolase family protein [Bacillus sp. FJAT-27225]OCA90567.1 hypothetical protein A8F94_01410 [Bacillus sp. FJAT-27225]
MEQAKKLKVDITKTVNLQYLVNLPKGFDSASPAKYPLLLFLHGSGERGTEIEQVKKHGLKDILSHNLPFIIVSPQCPEKTKWSMELDSLNALLDEVLNNYPIDENRIYLTGLSMGGYGTWDWAMTRFDTFAAIAPVCGGAVLPDRIENLKDIPVWAFHGEYDNVVVIEETKKLVNRLASIGGNVKATYYPKIGHDSWVQAYQNADLYVWMLSHSK